MGSIEQKQHVAGIVIIRAEGNLTTEDIDSWRLELEKFVKASEEKGACGALVDLSEIKEISIDAIDTIFELLADPEEVISGVRMRFALIGVKPFTQRFLREVMPLDEVKHIRAQFFHEVAEEEALAWLQAMVSSATDLPDVKPSVKVDLGKIETAKQVNTKVGLLALTKSETIKVAPTPPSKLSIEAKAKSLLEDNTKSVSQNAEPKKADGRK